jgi:hypothetical protein
VPESAKPAANDLAPPAPVPEPAAATTAPIPRGDYTGSRAIWFSPKVIQWIPAVSLVLVFFLMFFTWTGVYAGTWAAVSQTGWSTAWGWSQVDQDLLKGGIPISKFETSNVGVSFFMIAYVLLFLIFVLPLTIACLVLTFIKLDVPALQPYLPWRWGIAAILNILLFVLLFLQAMTSFGVEAEYDAEIYKQFKAASEKPDLSTTEKKQIDASKGALLSLRQRTTWWSWAFNLTLLSAVCTVMMYRLNQREKANLPLPRLDVLW